MLLRFPRAELFVEVVRTPADLAKGLSGRTAMSDGAGMLFDMGRTGQWNFTMANTWIPLDMIFLDGSGQVVGIIEAATPNTDGPYVIREPSRYVVEVNGGWADRHEVELGDRVSFG